METTGTFFVAKKQQSKIELSWNYVVKWKTLVGEKNKLLIQEYKDQEKIKKRWATHTLLLLKPVNLFISSLYKETGFFAFDYNNQYYKLHIDPETNIAKIEKYKLSLL